MPSCRGTSKIVSSPSCFLSYMTHYGAVNTTGTFWIGYILRDSFLFFQLAISDAHGSALVVCLPCCRNTSRVVSSLSSLILVYIAFQRALSTTISSWVFRDCSDFFARHQRLLFYELGQCEHLTVMSFCFLSCSGLCLSHFPESVPLNSVSAATRTAHVLSFLHVCPSVKHIVVVVTLSASSLCLDGFKKITSAFVSFV